MNITKADLERQYNALGHGTRVELKKIAQAHGGDLVNESLLIAVASRETNCQNIVGDGGHGRGEFQIDDRSHAAWLHSVPGCRSGTNQPSRGHTALDHGYCPTIAQGAVQACSILVVNYHAARAHDYGPATAKRIAVAAYNCGLGNALAGQANHDNPDHFTTGGDYSADTIARQRVIHDLAT